MKKNHSMLKTLFIELFNNNNNKHNESEFDKLIFPMFWFFQEVIKFKSKIEIFENNIIWNTTFVFYDFVKQLAWTLATWFCKQKKMIIPEFNFEKEINKFKKENTLFN
jgi:hypothetical protein